MESWNPEKPELGGWQKREILAQNPVGLRLIQEIERHGGRFMFGSYSYRFSGYGDMLVARNRILEKRENVL